MSKLKSLALCVLIMSGSAIVRAQKRDEVPSCKQGVFAQLQPLPKLNYVCRADAANDYDESILKWPERMSAINSYMRRLASFTARGWWEASVEELNLCYFRGSAGEFTQDEREKFRTGDYQINLFGNDRMRLVLTADPCYQTGYGGSNAFLLYRQGARVYVTQVLDGHFSRADNSVHLDFARLDKEQLIEVSTTTGGLNPYINNYYFVIDKRSGKAAPKRLFKEGRRLTSTMTSAMILDDSNIQGGSNEMEIIKANRLARTFVTYSAGNGPGAITDANGSKFQRRVYRWNGRYYSRIK